MSGSATPLSEKNIIFQNVMYPRTYSVLTAALCDFIYALSSAYLPFNDFLCLGNELSRSRVKIDLTAFMGVVWRVFSAAECWYIIIEIFALTAK